MVELVFPSFAGKNQFFLAKTRFRSVSYEITRYCVFFLENILKNLKKARLGANCVKFWLIFAIVCRIINYIMAKQVVQFRLDKDLHDFVKEYARLKRMSISQVIRLCVLEFYEEHQDEEDLVEMNDVSDSTNQGKA